MPNWQTKIHSLREQGRTDEQIAVDLGEILGGPGPSSRSVARWRTGETVPHRLYQGAITRLHDEVERT